MTLYLCNDDHNRAKNEAVNDCCLTLRNKFVNI
jgi:hypothetical protein